MSPFAEFNVSFSQLEQLWGRSSSTSGPRIFSIHPFVKNRFHGKTSERFAECLDNSYLSKAETANPSELDVLPVLTHIPNGIVGRCKSPGPRF
jgi:hypothetical protein